MLITTAPSLQKLEDAPVESMNRGPELMATVERSLNAESRNIAERREIMAGFDQFES